MVGGRGDGGGGRGESWKTQMTQNICTRSRNFPSVGDRSTLDVTLQLYANLKHRMLYLSCHSSCCLFVNKHLHSNLVGIL